MDNLIEWLHSHYADLDIMDRPIVRGAIIVGMDPRDVCVGSDAQYRRAREWYPICCTMAVAGVVI